MYTKCARKGDRYRHGYDELEHDRRKAELCVGCEEPQGLRTKVTPIFRTIQVPSCFLDLVKVKNERKIQGIQEAWDKRALFLKIKDRVYASRNAPPRLRSLTFERDDYTCQICLRPRVEVERAGSWLEADHKIAWEAGGQTCLENLQTTCRECNVGKHHASTTIKLLSH
ncbi:HNH endonuclease [Congregibacter litoralis]